MRRLLILLICGFVSANDDDTSERINKTANGNRITKRYLNWFPQPLVLGPYQAPPNADAYSNSNSYTNINDVDGSLNPFNGASSDQNGFLPSQGLGQQYDGSGVGSGADAAGEANFNLNSGGDFKVSSTFATAAASASGLGNHDVHDCNDDYHGYHTLQGVYQTIHDTQPSPPQQVITKEVRIPVPQPYPVTVEKKVPVPVPQPYPVQVIKPIPYRVEVKIPVPVPRPYPVQVYQKVPVRVPVYIKVPQPIRVPVSVPRPYTVEKRVPVPVQVKVPVYIRVPVPVPGPEPAPSLPIHHAHHDDCDHYHGGLQGQNSLELGFSQGQPASVYGPPGFQPGTPIAVK